MYTGPVGNSSKPNLYPRYKIIITSYIPFETHILSDRAHMLIKLDQIPINAQSCRHGHGHEKSYDRLNTRNFETFSQASLGKYGLSSTLPDTSRVATERHDVHIKKNALTSSVSDDTCLLRTCTPNSTSSQSERGFDVSRNTYTKCTILSVKLSASHVCLCSRT